MVKNGNKTQMPQKKKERKLPKNKISIVQRQRMHISIGNITHKQ